jgi:hypothetical protein
MAWACCSPWGLLAGDAVDQAEQGLLDELDETLVHLGLAGEVAVEGGLRYLHPGRQGRGGDLFRLGGFQHARQGLQDLYLAFAGLAHGEFRLGPRRRRERHRRRGSIRYAARDRREHFHVVFIQGLGQQPLEGGRIHHALVNLHPQPGLAPLLLQAPGHAGAAAQARHHAADGGLGARSSWATRYHT